MLYYQSEQAGAGVLGPSGSEHVHHTQRKRADGGSGCCSRVPMELAGLSCSLWLEGVPRQHTAPRRQLGSEVKWWKRRNQRERDGPREHESMRTSKAGRNKAARGDGETRGPPEMGKCRELHTQDSGVPEGVKRWRRFGATIGEREERRVGAGRGAQRVGGREGG